MGIKKAAIIIGVAVAALASPVALALTQPVTQIPATPPTRDGRTITEVRSWVEGDTLACLYTVDDKIIDASLGMYYHPATESCQSVGEVLR